MNFRPAATAFACALLSTLSYAQVVKGDPAKAQPIVSQVCAACHGVDGNSVLPVNPSLAAQHPEYTLKQLLNFKPRNGKPAERASPVMAGMVANLAPDDMANLAAYFARQKANPRAASDPDLVKLGREIYRGGILTKNVAACAACHSPNGSGIPAQYPRLAGQHAGYIESQLKAFRTGDRANDANGMMRSVAARLSDVEIRALAEYVSGLR
ncbi:MAG: c-type cytochrome [Betaproteobacteria bacterium]